MLSFCDVMGFLFGFKCLVFWGFCDFVLGIGGLFIWLNVMGIEVFFLVLWMWWFVGEWFGFGGG